MRPHWNRNHPRNAEAADDRLRLRYEDRRQTIGTIPFAVPDKLTRAIRDPRWSREPVQPPPAGIRWVGVEAAGLPLAVTLRPATTVLGPTRPGPRHRRAGSHSRTAAVACPRLVITVAASTATKKCALSVLGVCVSRE